MEHARKKIADARKSAEVAHAALGRATGAKHENVAHFSILVALNHLRDAVHSARNLAARARKEAKMAAHFAVIEIHSLVGIGNMIAELWEGAASNARENSLPLLVTSRRNIKEMMELLDEFAKIMAGLISLAGSKLEKNAASEANKVLARLEACKHS